MAFEFSKDDRPLSPQGWSVVHDTEQCTAMAPIHFDGQAVAVVMVKGDEGVGQLIYVGKTLVNRANCHEKLVAAAQAAKAIFERQKWLLTSTDPEALALRQLCDALAAAGTA